MAQEAYYPSVSIDIAKIMIRFAVERGIDGAKLWRNSGLDKILPRRDDARLTASHFHSLWQAIEQETGDGLFGLRLGTALKMYAGGHLVFAVLMNSPTVEAAIRKFCRYHSILSNVLQPHLIDNGRNFKIILEKLRPDLAPTPTQEDFILSLFVSLINSLAGFKGDISEVRFSHSEPKQIDFYRNIFACAMKFNRAESELHISKSVMTRPVFLANPDLLSLLESKALMQMEQLSNGNTTSQEVATTLTRMLMNGDRFSIRAVAKALAVSPRLLQLKLHSEHTSYGRILDHVRKKTAIRCLNDRKLTLTEITLILGFSEQSSFTRAFHVWTGMTPGQYRRKLINDPGRNRFALAP